MMHRLNTGKPPVDVLLLALVALIGAFYALTLRAGHSWGDDFAQYILHARNIAEGRAYGDLPFISNPFNFIGPEAYPPLLSVVLAPFYYFFGLNLTVMKLVLIAVFCAGLLYIGLVFRDRLPDSRRYALIVLFGMNPWLWKMKDLIQSEYLYILTSMLCLFVMHRNYQAQDHARSLVSSLVIGISMYLAYATREIGIVLAVTLLVIELLRRHTLSRYFFVAAGLFCMLFLIQQPLLEYGKTGAALNPEVLGLMQAREASFSTHVATLNFDFSYFFYQVMNYLEAAKDFWSPGNDLGMLLAAVTGLLALAGYVRQLIVRITVFEIYTAGYCLILFLFGGFQGVRYLIPVMPLYLYYTMLGLGVADLTGIRWLSKSLLALIMLGAAVVHIETYLEQDFREIQHGITSVRATGLLDYVRDSTLPDDLIVFKKPRALALLAERKTTIYPAGRDKKLVLDYIAAIDPDYVIAGNWNMDRETLWPVIEEQASFFRPVYSNGEFTVFRFEASAGPER